ncbi:hypothetical protein V1478_010660 [Vespula squamosa]|uniref:Secreted protein n=1 Tax=Vespula squamosa TaxID=30214 RepID=A0ABD2AIF2_VESSQ
MVVVIMMLMMMMMMTTTTTMMMMIMLLLDITILHINILVKKQSSGRTDQAINVDNTTYQSMVLVVEFKKILKMGLVALVCEWLNCYLTNVLQMRKTTSQKRQLN